MTNTYKAIWVKEEDYEIAIHKLGNTATANYPIPVYNEPLQPAPTTNGILKENIKSIKTISSWEYYNQKDKINEIITTLNNLIEKANQEENKCC